MAWCVAGKCGALVVVLSALSVHNGSAAERPVDFARDIRPILSDACFLCHGPDPENRKADLRLDTKDGALGDHGGTIAIAPGKLDESEAWLRIVSTDPAERMPPAKSGKKLSEKQVELIRRWIEQGAKWSSHWAFEAPVKPQAPVVRNDAWVRNNVDRFILSQIEREGLAPQAEADRVTLLRRLSLDLLGLPPSVEEVEAFVKDDRPQAYAELVERMLASPHYGERWGRIWLDAARYADSDGYEKDKPRFAWAYRDWVVGAFNRDLPYDQFIIEQLAGDLLPQPTQDQLVATGFLRNSMINEEGGVDPEQFRMEAMFDRMDAIGKGVLGLTIQCAQCHTHKYDPLTQEEYYRMFACLNNSHESNIAVYTPEQQMRRGELFRQIRDIEEQLQHENPDWPERMAAWEDSIRDNQPEWTVIQSEANDPSGGQKVYRMNDGSYLCQGYAPTKGEVVVKATAKIANITAFRLEQLNDPNLPLGGPGRSIRGTGALSEFKVRARAVGASQTAEEKGQEKVQERAEQKKLEQENIAGTEGKERKEGGKGKANEKWIKFVRATADVSPSRQPLEASYEDKKPTNRVTGPVEFAIDGKEETAWSIDIGPGRRNVPRKAVFVAEEPFGSEEGTEIEVHLVQKHGGWNSDDNQNYNLGRFRLAVTTAPDPCADPLPAAVREVLAVPRDQRTPAQMAAVFSYWRTTVPGWQKANARIEELWKQHPEGTSQLVLNERDETRMTYLLNRGDFLQPKQPVSPGAPGFLHALSTEGAPPRLAFARWLVDRGSPTAARSLVNRVWQAYFGTGLVSTSEDLGSQSEAPSHPELLDWLAVEFMEPMAAATPPLSKGGEGGVAPRVDGRSLARGATDDAGEIGVASSAVARGQDQRDPPNPPFLRGGDVDGAWSIKRLHRMIVYSATYRQASKTTPESLARDPANRLLARGPRFRVDAEVVRDIALAASGLLDRTLGGPSVFPPAPEFLFQPPASYGPKVWKVASDSNRYRRALYTFRFRSVPYPPLQNFDAPNGDFSCVRRSRSNTPLQALTALNEPIFLDCARALAQQTLRVGGACDVERIAYAFRRCVARAPTPRESDLLADLLARQTMRFGDGKENPWELAADDPEHPPELPRDATPAQLAAWTVVSRVLLNLDETITKE